MTKLPLLSSRLRQNRCLDLRFQQGWSWGKSGEPIPRHVREVVAGARARRGFKATYSPIITLPEGQAKFSKSMRRQAGVSLAPARSSGVVNVCAFAGDCTHPCVAHNGNGTYPAVARARQWRTDLLADPQTADIAVWLIGAELGAEAAKYPDMWVRPDTFSDLGWWGIVPSMPDHLTVGGYTKNPYVLGRADELHEWHTAYSWNESADIRKVRLHLALGGKVAIVTDRRKGQPVTDVAARYLGVDAPVVDADLTDEWVLADGPLIGDLTAKGKARRLVGGRTPDVTSPRFVEEVYGNKR